jgi:hypothetical protein
MKGVKSALFLDRGPTNNGAWYAPIVGSNYAVIEFDGSAPARWGFTLTAEGEKDAKPRELWKSGSLHGGKGGALVPETNEYVYVSHATGKDGKWTHYLRVVSPEGEDRVVWERPSGPYIYQRCNNVVIERDGSNAWFRIIGEEAVSVFAVPLRSNDGRTAVREFVIPREQLSPTAEPSCLYPRAEGSGLPYLVGADGNHSHVNIVRLTTSHGGVSEAFELPGLPTWTRSLLWHTQQLMSTGSGTLAVLQKNVVAAYSVPAESESESKSKSTIPSQTTAAKRNSGKHTMAARKLFLHTLCEKTDGCGTAGSGAVSGDTLLLSVATGDSSKGTFFARAYDLPTGKTLWNRDLGPGTVYSKSVAYVPHGGPDGTYVRRNGTGHALRYSVKTGEFTGDYTTERIGKPCPGEIPDGPYFVGDTNAVVMGCGTSVAYGIQALEWTR